LFYQIRFQATFKLINSCFKKRICPLKFEKKKIKTIAHKRKRKYLLSALRSVAGARFSNTGGVSVGARKKESQDKADYAAAAPLRAHKVRVQHTVTENHNSDSRAITYRAWIIAVLYIIKV
jgi:hypothetical protein